MDETFCVRLTTSETFSITFQYVVNEQIALVSHLNPFQIKINHLLKLTNGLLMEIIRNFPFDDKKNYCRKSY